MLLLRHKLLAVASACLAAQALAQTERGKIWFHVFADANGDSIKGSAEEYISDVSTKLVPSDPSGAEYSESTTAGPALWARYNNIPTDEGPFRFQVIPPYGYAISPVSEKARGSKCDPETGLSDEIVELTEEDYKVTCGLLPPGTVQVSVFYDLNYNGVRNNNDIGMGGITVSLINYDTGEVILDGEGEPVQGTTNAAGTIVLPFAPHGVQLAVLVDLPENKSFSPQDATNREAKDSDVNQTGVSDPFQVTHENLMTTFSFTAGIDITAAPTSSPTVDQRIGCPFEVSPRSFPRIDSSNRLWSVPRVETPEACEDECMKVPECNGYAYKSYRDICVLVKNTHRGVFQNYHWSTGTLQCDHFTPVPTSSPTEPLCRSRSRKMQGHVYREFRPIASYNACQVKCREEDACVAWSYKIKGTWRKTCQLYDSVDAMSRQNMFISGPKYCD